MFFGCKRKSRTNLSVNQIPGRQYLSTDRMERHKFGRGRSLLLNIVKDLSLVFCSQTLFNTRSMVAEKRSKISQPIGIQNANICCVHVHLCICLQTSFIKIHSVVSEKKTSAHVHLN